MVFFCAVLTMGPSMNCKVTKNTNFIGPSIQTFFVLNPIRQTPHPNMQRSLRIPNNFYFNHKSLLKRPFHVGVINVFILVAFFFFLFQPFFCFRHFIKPRAFEVLIPGHCFPSFNISKVIGITVFDNKTTPHSFLNLLRSFLFTLVKNRNFIPPLCWFQPGSGVLLLFSSARPSKISTHFMGTLACSWSSSSSSKGYCALKLGALMMHWMKGIKLFQLSCRLGVWNLHKSWQTHWLILMG